jgi:hypothetical protein
MTLEKEKKMKASLVILPLGAAITLLTYLNFWQMKNIDTQGKIINGDLLLYLVVSGLILFFFVNPVIVLTYRYGFSLWNKSLAPQFIYQSLPIACSLIIAWSLFREIPSNGTLAATILSIASILCIIFWE